MGWRIYFPVWLVMLVLWINGSRSLLDVWDPDCEIGGRSVNSSLEKFSIEDRTEERRIFLSAYDVGSGEDGTV